MANNSVYPPSSDPDRLNVNNSGTSPGDSKNISSPPELADQGNAWNSSQEQKSDVICPRLCLCGDVVTPIGGRLLSSIDCRGEEIESFDNIASLPLLTELLLLSSTGLTLDTLSQLLQVLHSVNEAHMDHNNIQRIEGWQACSQSLQFLVLDYNRIDYLPNGSFACLPGLLYLSLSYNNIEIIHGEAFRGLTKLRTLILAGNRLSEIDPQWFAPLRLLFRLGLANNQIHTLSDRDLQHLPNLQELDLSHNHLAAVDDKVLKNSTRLRALNLRSNNLQKIPTTALLYLIISASVDLSENYFEQITSYAFTRMNISDVHINWASELLIIDEFAFSGLTEVRLIEITHCSKLMYVDKMAFNDVPKLNTLNLSFNALISFESNILDMVPSIQMIDVLNNPFVCHCSLNWLLDDHQLQGRNVTVINVSSLTCSDAASYEPPHSLTISPLRCAPLIIPLFPEYLNISFQQTVSLYCKSIGIPRPKSGWIMADRGSSSATGSALTSTAMDNVRYGLRFLRDMLQFSYVDRSAVGNYTCSAVNSQGTASRQLNVNVIHSDISVVVSQTTDTTVTVIWLRIDQSQRYSLMYWRQDPRRDRSLATNYTVEIEHYMRQYTLHDLQPDSHYRVCIAIQHSRRFVVINCTSAVTRDGNYGARILHSSRNYFIGGMITALGTLIGFLCLGSYLVRRYDRRHERHSTASTAHLFGSELGEQSGVTFESTHHPGDAEDDYEEDYEEMTSLTPIRRHLSL